MRFDETTGASLGDFVAPGTGGLSDSVMGLAFGLDGTFYVADFLGNRVLPYRGDDGSPLDTFSTNRLTYPVGLIVGPDSNLYVTTYGSGGVAVLDSKTGVVVQRFGQGILGSPHGLRFGPDGMLYVADQYAGVVRFDSSTGTSSVFIPQAAFTSIQSSLYPWDIVFGSDGDVYASDAHSQVLRFDGITGAFREVFASGHDVGLRSAEGMAFGPDGNLYVVGNNYEGGGRQGVFRFDGKTGVFVDYFAQVGDSEQWGAQMVTFTPRAKEVSAVVPWGSIGTESASVPAYVPGGLTNVLAVSGGYNYAMALLEDQTVVTWGQLPGPFPAGLSNVVAIAGGGNAGMALQADGRVTVFGTNIWGQLDVPSDLTDVAAVSAGGYFCAALRKNGTVAAWGNGGWGSPDVVPPGLNEVSAISAGAHHCLALRSNGTVTAWGYNGHLQTSVPEGLSDVIAVAAGFTHSMALRADGSVVVWGGQLGAQQGQEVVPPDLNDVVAIATRTDHNLALKADGTVVAWGRNDYGQSVVPAGLSNVVGITGGNLFSLALKRNPSTGPAPIIVSQSGNQTASVDGSVTLFVRAEGTAPLRYRWAHDGIAIAGATGASLTLSDLAASDAGSYTATVLSPLGTSSASMDLQVVIELRLTPENPTISTVQSATFAVLGVLNDDSLASLGAEWTSSNPSVAEIGADGVAHPVGQGSTKITASYGSLVAETLLLVTNIPPSVSTPLVNRSVAPGASVEWCATINGSQPMSVQWRYNGADIAGASNNCLAVPVASADTAGLYSLVLSNAFGTQQFDAALSLLELRMFAGLIISGPPGAYRIEALENAGGSDSWTILGTNTVTREQMPFYFFDTNSPSHSHRFYRSTWIR